MCLALAEQAIASASAGHSIGRLECCRSGRADVASRTLNFISKSIEAEPDLLPDA
jgi:hypothetical protein